MSHNQKPRTHEEARSVVCVACFNKSLNGRKISLRLAILLKQYLPNFSVKNLSYPTGLCATCTCYIYIIEGLLIFIW